MTATATWPLAAPATAETAAGTYTPGRDLLLDANGDLVIESGDLQLSTGVDAINQDIRLTITLFLGEWFRDVDLGLPWEQEILTSWKRC